MASEKIQDIVDRFVAEIVQAAEEEVLLRIREKLGVVMTPVVTRRKSSKGKSRLKPCPIDGCKNRAAPRYRMVCKDHSEQFTKEEILEARRVAAEPGGLWYKAPAPPRKKKSLKGTSIARQCPVKGCDGRAVPRYQMVCAEHSKKLSREKILIARDIADKPGGIWYEQKKLKKSA